MPLTDLACKTAKPKDKPYKLSDGEGMYLEVLPTGGRYWRMKYRISGKEKRLAIGVYPEVSLVEARDARDAARKRIRTGEDPSFVKQDTKRLQKLNRLNTFEAIGREWHEHRKEEWSENSSNTALRRLEREIFPYFGNVPIRDISTPLVLETIKKIEARAAYDVARRCLQLSSQIFFYAIRTGRADNNPCLALKGALKNYKKGNYASLEVRELPEFLQVFYRNDGRSFMQTRLAMEMMLLTFVRTKELLHAKWNEFDLEEALWIIPAERMKMRQSHIVPLSRQTLSLLHELKRLNGHREHVFPGQRNPRAPMSNGAILMMLDRMGYRGRMTGHGFRALAMSTIKERLDYRHEVIDRQLAHAHRNQVDAAYDRAKFLDERKVMMQEWADYIDKLAAKNNVVPLHTKAA